MTEVLHRYGYQLFMLVAGLLFYLKARQWREKELAEREEAAGRERQEKDKTLQVLQKIEEGIRHLQRPQRK